ncbi:hypothetical protein [uncultured Oscillibacter sp.]|uniref:hypothetical protein n=1 Tax=uncultured Oscillibacter sp. TaxID=876091 RepID=UPI00261EDB4E|nr:hypothetical protein [uncultured Oscillibacter sp.]
MDTPFPDYVQVDFSLFNGFKFKLPAVAMGIDDPMIVEIAAEFGESATEPGMLLAQAWAREQNSATSGFITSVYVPAKVNESPAEQGERLFRALNESQDFTETLTRFIHLMINSRR